MAIEQDHTTYDEPIDPISISTPEAMGSMPHRVLRFPSEGARNRFLERAVNPRIHLTDDDFSKSNQELPGGEHSEVDMFYSAGKNSVLLRRWSHGQVAQDAMDSFIMKHLYDPETEEIAE